MELQELTSGWYSNPDFKNTSVNNHDSKKSFVILAYLYILLLYVILKFM